MYKKISFLGGVKYESIGITVMIIYKKKDFKFEMWKILLKRTAYTKKQVLNKLHAREKFFKINIKWMPPTSYACLAGLTSKLFVLAIG